MIKVKHPLEKCNREQQHRTEQETGLEAKDLLAVQTKGDESELIGSFVTANLTNDVYLPCLWVSNLTFGLA